MRLQSEEFQLEEYAPDLENRGNDEHTGQNEPEGEEITKEMALRGLEVLNKLEKEMREAREGQAGLKAESNGPRDRYDAYDPSELFKRGKGRPEPKSQEDLDMLHEQRELEKELRLHDLASFNFASENELGGTLGGDHLGKEPYENIDAMLDRKYSEKNKPKSAEDLRRTLNRIKNELLPELDDNLREYYGVYGRYQETQAKSEIVETILKAHKLDNEIIQAVSDQFLKTPDEVLKVATLSESEIMQKAVALHKQAQKVVQEMAEKRGIIEKLQLANHQLKTKLIKHLM